MAQERVRRAIENRPAERLLASDLLDQPLGDERLHRIIAFHAANLLDLRLGDGLSVRDDRQRLHDGLGKRLLLHRLEQLFDIGRVVRPRRQLHMRAEAQQPQPPPLKIIAALQRVERLLELRLADLHRAADVLLLHGVARDEENGLDDAHALAQLKPRFLLHRLRRQHRHLFRPHDLPSPRAGSGCPQTSPPARRAACPA